MRDLKFRGFIDNQMLSAEDLTDWTSNRKWLGKKDAILMQYIGLKDKSGVEIYEGDYLVDYYPVDEEDESKGMNESLMPVVWCDKHLLWCVDASFAKNGGYLTSLVEYFGEFLEVRGNIYEEQK